MVLLMDERFLPLKWSLGRATEFFSRIVVKRRGLTRLNRWCFATRGGPCGVRIPVCFCIYQVFKKVTEVSYPIATVLPGPRSPGHCAVRSQPSSIQDLVSKSYVSRYVGEASFDRHQVLWSPSKHRSSQSSPCCFWVNLLNLPPYANHVSSRQGTTSNPLVQ